MRGVAAQLYTIIRNVEGTSNIALRDLLLITQQVNEMLSVHPGDTASATTSSTTAAAVSSTITGVTTSASSAALATTLSSLEASASTPSVAVVVAEGSSDVIQAWQYSIADTVTPNTVLKELERLSKELAQLLVYC